MLPAFGASVRANLGVVGALGVVAVLAVLTSANIALAGNEAHVRTPVLWPDSSCRVVVERGVDPVLHVDYAIPVEDTVKTADELPDSRTHQFVALCRQHPLTELVPPWITRDDVERSVVAGRVAEGEVSYREILDESTLWTDCFARITPDDGRRPITFAEAAAGVDWDTSTVSPGIWTVAGYTFEPSLNLWRERPGFVKVVDDALDPDQDVPGLALVAGEQIVEVGAPIELAGCVDVLEPATVHLEWAAFAPSLDWQPWTEVEITADGDLDLASPAPPEAAGIEILIRARLVDALGREFIGHAPSRVSVLPCPAAGCPEPAGPEDPPLGPGTDGASCAISDLGDHPIPASALAMLLVLGLAARRRRSFSPRE